jgi:hypothetical protein
MEDLVLTTRLDSLQKSFEQVRGVVTLIQERRRDMDPLLNLINRSGTVWRDAFVLRRNIQISESNLEFLRHSVEGYDKEQVNETLSTLREAGEAVRNILGSLDEANSTINSVLRQSVEVVEDSGLGKMLREALAYKAEDFIADLWDIRGTLEEARKVRQAGGDQTEAEALMQQAWKKYTSKINTSSQPLFAEYVDLLGGLALRDTGFDEGVCRLGDELVSKWASAVRVDWDSLTIPAYQEALTMTPARIIRLGFPEWTLWALPLTAHQFGHVVVRQSMDSEKRSKLKGLIEAGKPDERTKSHREEYAADAIATYAMGPAYACAAILLRFDPLLAYKDQDEHPAYAKRAHVVLATLGWVNRQDSVAPYSGIIEQLRREWNAALDQVRPVGKLEDSEIAELDVWLDGLWEYLHTRRNPMMYSARDWVEIADWPEKLLQGREQEIGIKNSHELRDVLNAAWKCRIAYEADAQKIGDAALVLWQHIADKKREDMYKSLGVGGSRLIPRRLKK